MAEERRKSPSTLLLVGGAACGVLAGALLASYWWVKRHQAALKSPLERAEQLIANCEEKMFEIQGAITSLTSPNGESPASLGAQAGG